MFYLVASAATLIYYHIRIRLSTTFLTFFKFSLLFSNSQFMYTSRSHSQLDYIITWYNKCQLLFYFLSKKFQVFKTSTTPISNRRLWSYKKDNTTLERIHSYRLAPQGVILSTATTKSNSHAIKSC